MQHLLRGKNTSSVTLSLLPSSDQVSLEIGKNKKERHYVGFASQEECA